MSLDKMIDSAQLDANLTAIANKIRTGIETTEQLSFPNDFISSIDDIARADLTVPKDVDFIDYDGRLIYSYTASEFLELEEMPANPTNKGLIAQGWNWTLEDAQDYVSKYGALVIGQSYITDNGKTRIYIEVFPFQVEFQAVFQINLHGITSGTVIISWGDGVSSTITGTGAKSVNHVYQNVGKYLIEINVVSGNYALGANVANSSAFDNPSNNTTNGRAGISIKKIEIGSGITKFGRQPIRDCNNLKSITIPVGVTDFVATTASSGSALTSPRMSGLVLPNGFNGKSSATITTLTGMKYISLPKSTTTFNIDASGNLLRKFTIYEINDATSTIKLNYCRNLTHFVMPGTYTTLASNAVNGSCVKKIIIPETVETIQTEAYLYSYFAEIHVLPTTVPTLNNTRAFLGLGPNSVIYVPYSADHSILEAYKAATNWSTFASYMQEEPQT